MVWSGKYLTEMTRGRQCSLTHGTNQNTIDGHDDDDDDDDDEEEEEYFSFHCLVQMAPIVLH